MAEIDFSKIKCDHEGCTVSIDGKCLEGLELSQCSFHHPIEVESASNLSEEISPSEEILETVFSGEALNANECRSITSASITNVIILAGRAESGKTTLISSIFDIFQKENSFDGYIFGGSRSLIGLEKRCHESRIASERGEPNTERTKFTPDDPKFIHFKLQKKGNGALKDILFTDISGEQFRQISNSTEECQKFDVIKRADHFVLFFDSNLLSDFTTRHQTKTNGFAILRSLVESNMLNSRTMIQIVYSKWDLLLQKGEMKEHIEFINEISNEIRLKYSDTIWNIRFFEIASRPDVTSNLSFGYGIDKLLPIWVDESSLFSIEREKSNSVELSTSSTREFSKYRFLKID